jgi:hypothetical protein
MSTRIRQAIDVINNGGNTMAKDKWLVAEINSRKGLTNVTQLKIGQAIADSLERPLETVKGWLKGNHDPSGGVLTKKQILKTLDGLEAEQAKLMETSPINCKVRLGKESP